MGTKPPPLATFLRNGEEPPLDLPANSFDLVYAVSVFTHLTEHWSGWLAEMHRLLRPGGLGVFSFLGEMLWEVSGAGRFTEWVDDETGMMVTGLGRTWDEGGPNVFHSEWWLREHWGRGFEVLDLRPRDMWKNVPGHGWISLRRKEGNLSPEELERFDPSNPREARAMARNLRILMHEAGDRAQHTENLQHDAASLRQQLETIYRGRSWKLTAPLRAAADAGRQRLAERRAR